MPTGVYCRRNGHGQTHSLTYSSWRNMHSRCKYPYHGSFKYCGAKGISVCAEWASFARFLADMGPRPSVAHSIDRIDNAQGYSKNNCRWATMSEQKRNMYQTINITIDGETLCATDWANRVGLKPSTVLARITKMKWDPVRAVTTPLRLNQWAAGKRRL